jgi:hypothetical protein
MERLKASADCWLSLAAAPTFAIMAFVTAAFGGGPQDLFCAAAQHASELLTPRFVVCSIQLSYGRFARRPGIGTWRGPSVFHGKRQGRA